MATYTTNYNLKKPADSDFINIADLNGNADIIDEELKVLYYRGLSQWRTEQGYLMDTCLAAQDTFKKYLDYFRIEYEE